MTVEPWFAKYERAAERPRPTAPVKPDPPEEVPDDETEGYAIPEPPSRDLGIFGALVLLVRAAVRP